MLSLDRFLRAFRLVIEKLKDCSQVKHEQVYCNTHNTKKLVSRLFDRGPVLIAKRRICFSGPLFWGRGNCNWNFSLALIRLRHYYWKSGEFEGDGSLLAKISGWRGRPEAIVVGLRKLEQLSFISYQNIGKVSFVLSQSTHLADRRKDKTPGSIAR